MPSTARSARPAGARSIRRRTERAATHRQARHHGRKAERWLGAAQRDLDIGILLHGRGRSASRPGPGPGSGVPCCGSVSRYRIVHLLGRSLCAGIRSSIFRSMFGHSVRRIAVFVLAFGVFANGAAGAWAFAAPAVRVHPASVATTSMAAMDMRHPCVSQHDKRPPGDKMPSKCAGAFCIGCIAGAVSMAFEPASSPAEALLRDSSQMPARDVNRKSIAVKPALPPPIVLV